MSIEIEKLKFDSQGLIPAVIQDVQTKEVLMLAYMNLESLEKTLTTGLTWFWSRSRQELWNKGATSGHFQYVQEMAYDCDADTLLVNVIQEGAACHEGDKSCFHYPLELKVKAESVQLPVDPIQPASAEIIEELYGVIMDRKVKLPEGSYTTYLFNKGLDKILKQVGEETAEVIIGAKNQSKDEVVYETADLFYHLLVLLAQQEIKPKDIFNELSKRR